MAKNLCKSEDEVNEIIRELLRENPNLDVQLIKKAIESCCIQSEIVKTHGSFIGCVKERIRMLRVL